MIPAVCCDPPGFAFLLPNVPCAAAVVWPLQSVLRPVDSGARPAASVGARAVATAPGGHVPSSDDRTLTAASCTTTTTSERSTENSDG